MRIKFTQQIMMTKQFQSKQQGVFAGTKLGDNFQTHTVVTMTN